MDMTGHHDNRDTGGYFIRLESPANFVAFDIGQTVVNKDEIWLEPLRLF